MMGETTAISWTDHTFNPWMGCTKVSPACDHCYAEALGKRTGRVQWGDDAERVVTSDGYWKNPLKWNAAAEKEGRRHRVFCASLADVFEDRDELDPVRARLFTLIEDTPWLDWQLLTKRPEQVPTLARGWMAVGWPSNVWLGTTVEDEERAAERIPALLAIPAAVRFLSCEPLLDWVRLGKWCARLPTSLRWDGGDGWIPEYEPQPTIDWVICGGESGPGHRPLNLDHARRLRDNCLWFGIPFFFKQVGGRTPTAGGNLLDGREHHDFPSTYAPIPAAHIPEPGHQS